MIETQCNRARSRAAARSRAWNTLVAGTLTLVVAGCDEATPPGPQPEVAADEATSERASPVTYHQTVKPIVDAKCAGCHTQGGIAPFSLTGYEDLKAHAGAVRAAVAERVMPPWLAAPGVRHYLYDASLSDAQIDALVRWIDTGLAVGDPARPGAPLPRDASDLASVDLTLSLPEAYVPPRDQANLYRCFVLDWPYDHPVYVTGFDARPGNPAIVHHLQAYLAVPADVPAVLRYDAEDPGLGYTCFGAPWPANAPIISPRFLGGWTPGRGAMRLPEGTGVEVAKGSKVVLQVHYHLDHLDAHAKVDGDRSSLLMSIAERVTTPGLYVPWMDDRWALDPRTMLIPAGATSTTHGYRAKPSNSLVFWVFSGNTRFPNGFTLHSVYPHAHKLARRITASVVHAGAATEPLIEIPRWDFDWQREYALAEPARVGPDDELSVTCTYSNTEADQLAATGEARLRDVTWGEGTEDEMCSLTLYVTAN